LSFGRREEKQCVMCWPVRIPCDTANTRHAPAVCHMSLARLAGQLRAGLKARIHVLLGVAVAAGSDDEGAMDGG
jgi:hypothetical protein